MRHGGTRIRQLVGTLATASAVLACAPAAQADHVSSHHDFSFSAKSARVSGGSLVLTGVEGNGLLRQPRRGEHAKMSVRQFVREWKRLGARPYAAATHRRGGARELVSIHPNGTPKYDAERRRITIPVRDRRPRKLAETRWMFASSKVAGERYWSQSKTVGPFQFVVTAPAFADETDITVVAGGAVFSAGSLSVANPISTIHFGVLGQGSLSATVRYVPRGSDHGGTVFLSASWTDPAGSRGQFSGLLAQLQRD